MSKNIRLFMVFLLIGNAAYADLDVDEQGEWSKRIKSAEVMGALGDNLFGDSVNYYSGETSFSATDIDLPGNNAIPVRIARTRTTEANRDESTYNGAFSDWEIDVPYMKGVFASGYPWQVVGTSPNNRCSASNTTPVTVSGWQGPSYWRGNTIYVPGSGGMEVISSSVMPSPADGKTTRFYTSKFWQIRCGVQLDNPTSSGFSGEGFTALAPDGTKYTFSWMATRTIKPAIQQIPPTPPQTVAYKQLPRIQVRIYATRVEDRFGNWVSYAYSGSQLTQISSSDGRLITLNYNANGRIATASAFGKTWTYDYTTPGVDFLKAVTLPDQTKWQYTFPFFGILYSVDPGKRPTCMRPGVWDPVNQDKAIHIIHPSGAIGDFTLSLVRHGRTQVDNACPADGDPQSPYGTNAFGPPILTDNYGITSKQISGPGLAVAVWTTTYSAPIGSALANGGGGPVSETATVKNPDGSQIRYTFGIRQFIDEGKLERVETLSSSGVLLRDTQMSYAITPSSTPYPYVTGSRGGAWPDDFADVYLTPRTKTVIVDNGTTYTNTVNSFDSYADEVKVTRANSLGSSRTDTTTYFNDTTKWVIGQVQSKVNNDTGQVEFSVTFDPSTVKPYQTYSFGLLQRSMTYNSDGTLATQGNGLNETIMLGNWKRGSPQLITFADNTSQSAAIDDSGMISSVTDELGSVIGYSYYASGRLAGITWPTGDSINWAPRQITYQLLTSSELGVPAGSWRMRVTESAHQQSIYYDARLNPLLQEEKDTIRGVTRYIAHAYDSMGRMIFESYPSASPNPTQGVNLAYDEFGRIKSKVTTNGIVLSTIAYGANNSKSITDASHNTTQTTFQAFDRPEYGKPLTITGPEYQVTTYTRDIFGDVLLASRSGGGGTITESNVYDTYHRLCKIIRPESGQHVISLDAAGRMAWSASGIGGSATTCDLGSVAASEKTLYSYDLRGRLTLVDFADNSGDITRGYDLAGRLKTVSNPTATWTYGYNKRGLVESQNLVVSGHSYTMTAVYDDLGHVSNETYPDGFNVIFMPNAFGEDTQVGSFASVNQRHPTGAIQNASFGNGLTYSTTLDSRSRISSQSLINGVALLQGLNYGYNDDSQLTSVSDQVDGTDSAIFSYDGLHRLKIANGLWGSYAYNYDAVGNLKSRVDSAGVNSLTYSYDNKNSLLNVSGASSRSYVYDSRGRVTGDGRFIFSWNQADQIIGPQGVANYSYDGNGKRVKSSPAGGTTEYAFYDLTGHLRATLKGGISTDYIDFDGKPFIERTSAGVITYLHPDWLGSPRLATSVNGTVVWREHFDPFGKKLNGVTEKRGFTGHSYDRETGLTYMLARYYDADVGRFLMTDPIGSKDDLNLYGYVHNDPVNGLDPTGLCSTYRDQNCEESGLDGMDGSKGKGSRVVDFSLKSKKPGSMPFGSVVAKNVMKKSTTPYQPDNRPANVVYHETSGLRPIPDKSTDEDLHDARVAAAHVYNNVKNKNAFQDSGTLGADEQKALEGGFAPAVKAYNDSVSAVTQASKEPDNTNGSKHFFIHNESAGDKQRTPAWANGNQIVYGPFKTSAPGDGVINKGDTVYIWINNTR